MARKTTKQAVKETHQCINHEAMNASYAYPINSLGKNGYVYYCTYCMNKKPEWVQRAMTCIAPKRRKASA